MVRIWGPDNRGVCPDIFVNFNKHTEDTFWLFGGGIQIMKILTMQFSPDTCHFLPPTTDIDWKLIRFFMSDDNCPRSRCHRPCYGSVPNMWVRYYRQQEREIKESQAEVNKNNTTSDSTNHKMVNNSSWRISALLHSHQSLIVFPQLLSVRKFSIPSIKYSSFSYNITFTFSDFSFFLLTRHSSLFRVSSEICTETIQQNVHGRFIPNLLS